MAEEKFHYYLDLNDRYVYFMSRLMLNTLR